MAQQTPFTQSVKWKLGSKCDLFVREDMEWKEGEIIGSFSDEKGEWVKVRCGQNVHNVLCRDPDLRQQASNDIIVSVDKVKELEEAFLSNNVASGASIFKQLLAGAIGNESDAVNQRDHQQGIICQNDRVQSVH